MGCHQERWVVSCRSRRQGWCCVSAANAHLGLPSPFRRHRILVWYARPTWAQGCPARRGRCRFFPQRVELQSPLQNLPHVARSDGDYVSGAGRGVTRVPVAHVVDGRSV